MDPGVATQLFFLFILLALSAFFSSAETALTTVSKIKLLDASKAGEKRADLVLKVIDNRGKMLSTILIGNNIVNNSAAALSTTIAMALFGSAAVGIATGILTLLVLIFGEITPKNIATEHCMKMSYVYAPVISFLMTLFTPVVFIVSKLSGLLLKLCHIDPNSQNQAFTESELRTILEVSHDDGVIEAEEREMIYNVFDFGDSRAKDIMVPKVDMVFVDVNASYHEIIQIFKEEQYTRLPVYEESTDHVIGLINVKDLLVCDDPDHFQIRSILREPYYTYEYKKTSELMVEMRKESNNFTIVLDEYGATVGLVTLEDLLEEIVGEIRDEYDQAEEDLIQQINEQEYIVEGSMSLDDVNDALNLELDSEDYDSVGGYIIEHLDHLPEEKEFVVTEEGIKLVADVVNKTRVEKVHIYIPEPKEDSKEEDSDTEA